MNLPLKDELGQVWTPDYIVESMLDEIGYASSNPHILEQKIMEPSFGAGAFLYEILEQLIECALNNNKSTEEIEQIVDRNIYGIEYDTDTFSSTVKNIKQWLKTSYGLSPLLNNLHCMDTLDFQTDERFDYVIGNPPYIRVHDMPAEMRKKLKTYKHSTGNSDLYIIFFEIGLDLLNDNGKLAYITPNTWLRNSSQKSFRKSIVQHQQIQKIINFNSDRVFDNVGTYTCIAYLNKKPHNSFTYIDASKDLTQNYSRIIEYYTIDLAKNDTLAFSSETDQQFLNRHLYNNNSENLGNLCKIQNGILTLGNKYFTINEYDKNFDNLGIDDLIYPAIKASTYKGEEIKQRMVFPYKKINGKFRGLTEDEMRKQSIAFSHLLKSKDLLSIRSLEHGSLWFWYRSQSLQETDKRKLVFSHVISPKQERISAYIVPENVLVYGGLFITEKEPDLFSQALSLEEIKEIVESESFIKYCRILGKDLSGGYKTFSTSTIKKFNI